MITSHTIGLELGRFGEDLRALGNGAALVVARALNRAGVAGKTAMSRAIKADSGMMAKYIGRAIELDKANRNKLSVTFFVNAERIPLIGFGARGPEPSKGRGRGVTAGVRGGRKSYPGAFIAKMPYGGATNVDAIAEKTHKGVFRRANTTSGKSRGAWSKNLPIIELRGPSVAWIFLKKLDVFREAAQGALLKNLEHEITFAKSKAAGTTERPEMQFPAA